MLVSPCRKLSLDRPYRSDSFLLTVCVGGSRLHAEVTAPAAGAKAGSCYRLIRGKQESEIQNYFQRDVEGLNLFRG